MKGEKFGKLRNLGKSSYQMLENAGIENLDQLQKLGSVRAYYMVKRSGQKPSLNLLWALEGALTDLHWTEVAREHRTSLLLSLDQLENES